MGVSLSTAKYLGPASFVYDFVAQQYGINSKPSMMDVHNQNISFWSPNPYFIGAFFFPQQLFQLAWLYKLVRNSPNNPKEAKELEQIVKFVPYYAIGNVCIGTWMFFWNSSRLEISNVFVWVNSLTQLFYVFTQLEPMDTNNWGSILTHIVSKTFAGIGVLDLVHNTSVAYFKDAPPTTLIKAITGAGFLGLSAFSDWIFGGCLVYDLVGLAVGQYKYNGPEWSYMLGAFAAGSAAIIAARNLAKPPYKKPAESDYIQAAQDEVDDRV